MIRYFSARRLLPEDVEDGDELLYEDLVLADFRFCEDCGVVVAPDLHDEWHRRLDLGRALLSGPRLLDAVAERVR